jgi:hypothetical protein
MTVSFRRSIWRADAETQRVNTRPPNPPPMMTCHDISAVPSFLFNNINGISRCIVVTAQGSLGGFRRCHVLFGLAQRWLGGDNEKEGECPYLMSHISIEPVLPAASESHAGPCLQDRPLPRC